MLGSSLKYWVTGDIPRLLPGDRKQVTAMTSLQLMLEDISKRYDPAYDDRIQVLTQEKMETYPPSCNAVEASVLQAVALFQVMDEEGFSHSERGAVFAAALEKLTGTSLSAQAWQEIMDMPVYGIESFSPGVSKELKGISNPMGE